MLAITDVLECQRHTAVIFMLLVGLTTMQISTRRYLYSVNK